MDSAHTDLPAWNLKSKEEVNIPLKDDSFLNYAGFDDFGPMPDYEDHINKLQKAHSYLNLVSLISLGLAFLVWTFEWYRNRERQAYRYAFLLFIIGANIAFQVLSLTPSLTQIPNQVVLLSLTAYAALTAIRAQKQVVTPPQTLVAVAICTVLPLIIGLLRWRLTSNLVSASDYLALVLSMNVIPNFLMIVVGLSLASLLLYWVFALDNSRYREYRDYRVIRYSSVCLFVVLLYCLAIEISGVVFNHLDQYTYTRWLRLELFVNGRGLVLSLLLCFLDLEVWGSCPCGLVDLGDEEEMEVETKPLANSGVAPANDEPASKTHVASFETEITPRLTLVSKPAYGTIQD